MTAGNFSGETADFYARYRRGYPSELIARIANELNLGPEDTVLDLGCGTGQLTLPLARLVKAAVGMDPEADMLRRARERARQMGIRNAIWVLGSDAEVGSLGSLGAFAAVTIGQALHLMSLARLLEALPPMLRPGGGVVIVANGTPLWLQDSSPSRALRAFLESWLDVELKDQCGTDAASRERYSSALRGAGFEIREASFRYVETLGIDQIVGGVFSAMSPGQLPAPAERDGFAQRLAHVLPADEPFVETVDVRALIAVKQR